jgi:hypothetical protein
MRFRYPDILTLSYLRDGGRGGRISLHCVRPEESGEGDDKKKVSRCHDDMAPARRTAYLRQMFKASIAASSAVASAVTQFATRNSPGFGEFKLRDLTIINIRKSACTAIMRSPF